MTVYKRPNLSPAQCDLVESLLKTFLNSFNPEDLGSAAFDLGYRALIKVRDAKEITTGR